MNTRIVGRSMLLLFLGLGFAPSAASPAPLSGAPARDETLGRAGASALLGKLPLDFVANRGQWDQAVRFAARKGEMAASFGDRDIVLLLGKAGATSLALRFEGASSDVHLVGEDERAGSYNFAIGNDPSKWRSNVPAYAALRYRGIYPGIDVRVREEAGQLEYDLLLAAGADLGRAVLRAEGASALEIATDGALIIWTTGGTSLRQTPPVTWEELPGGERRPLASRFRIIDGQRYGFEAPDRDARHSMIVDPGLEWSTFLGGSSREFVSGIAAAGDGSGDLIVAGSTSSADFPTSPSLPSGGNTMFVARLTADGGALSYVTFLGGTGGTNLIFGLVSDPAGAAVIAGVTDGIGFPTTAGAYRRIPAGAGDGFVTRLDGAGGVVFSTLLGGTGPDRIRAVAVDAIGDVIVGGWTGSADFPTTTGVYDTTFNSTSSAGDAFVTKLRADGTGLLYSTFFGGQSFEEIAGLVVDGQGFVSVVGSTLPGATGTNLPVTPDAFDTTLNGHDDVFVARFKLDGLGTADLKYSTVIGGDNRDIANAVAFDPANPELVTVAGWSFVNVLSPPRYPTTSGALKTVLTPVPPATTLFPHSRTGFVTRFRFPAGGPGTLVWSTYFGGNFDDYITGLAVDPAGAVVVAGGTRSHDYPTTRGAFDRTYAGEYIGAPFAAQPDECFVASIRGDGSALLYSTFLGGSGADCALDDFFKPVRVVTMGATTVAVAGNTVSPDFPSTPGVVQPAYKPGPPQFAPAEDGFAAELTLTADASGDLSVGTPTLQTPANFTTFPTTGDVTLRWNDVADPSGIEAYVYQISTRSDFPRDFIQYTGSVSTPSFLARSLSTGTHFWRVQAADRAGNLGAFSPAFSFTTGVTGANPVLGFIRLDPQRVNGGTTSNGTLFLNFGAVALPGGAVVTLRSGNPGLVTVPAAVTIPAGANSAPFTFGTSTVAATTSVAIIGELGLTQTATLTLEPASVTLLRSLTLSPSSVTAGAGSTGTVTLSNPAPTGGAVVALSSNNPAASVPLNVTVAAGAISATFPISTSTVTVATSVNISAGYGTSLFATLTVNTGSPTGSATPASLALSPASVTGGVSTQGTVTLSGPAPTGGAAVTLSSSNTNVATVPASVTVAAGSSSTVFTVTTRSVTSSTTVTITAARGGVTRSAVLTVTRLAAPSLLSPASGATPAQPVTLDWNDVTGAASYNLQVDNSSTFSAPFVVNQTVTASQFTAGTLASRQHWWRVRAVSAAGTTSSFSSVRSFTPQAVASAPALASLSVSPTSVVGGGSSQGTATLTAAAPTGGAVVTLSSNNTGVAAVPVSVTVAAGGTSATFTITTQAVAASTGVTITGSYGGATRTASLTVTPPAATASLASLSVSPTSVVGGGSSQGTATLTAAAPTGGAVVTLSSNNTGVAAVPASVTVAAGSTSATFTITTQAVAASTGVTITGSYGGATRTTPLAVTPPAQTVTLTVTATGRSGERVVSSPAGINVSVGSTGSAPFASGTSITLSVSNGRDAIWSGACSSGGDKRRSCTFTLTGNASVGANVQ